MSDQPLGLSRSELEYELRWMMRKAPRDPARMNDFFGEVMVTLFEKNNARIAKDLAERERSDLPDPS